MTGDVLGTLRYMSPEQALAKHGLVDHRTDIYSLGVTLYELLTGSPAVTGKDREEILNAITLAEPRPPRTVDATIPHDLEIIVLKAIAKEPAERYATAQELADDLERLLQNKPIQARRPGPALILLKWGRRHRSLVTATAVMLGVLVVVLAISIVLLSSQRNEATRNLVLAQESLAREEATSKRERQQATEARQNKMEADKQRQKAIVNYRKARQAVDDSFTMISESQLLQDPQMDSLRRELLQAALRYYKVFAEEQVNDLAVRSELAASYLRIAQVTQALDGGDEWFEAFEKAVVLVESLVRSNVSVEDLGSLRDGIYRGSGRYLNPPNHPEKLLPVFQKACTIWEQLVAVHPSIAGLRNDLAGLSNVTGLLQLMLKMPEEAIRSHERSRELWLQLVREKNENPYYRAILALNDVSMADALVGANRLDQALIVHRRAASSMEKLVSDFPRSPLYRRDLARASLSEAMLHFQLHRFTEMEQVAERARDHADKLVSSYPSVPEYRLTLSGACNRLGLAYYRAGKLQDAEKVMKKGVKLLERLAVDFPDRLTIQSSVRDGLQVGYYNLAGIAVAMHQFEEAAKSLRQVIVLNPKFPPAYRDLALLLSDCPDPKVRDPVQAVETAKKAMELAGKDPDCKRVLGITQYRAGKWKEAAETLGSGIPLSSSVPAYRARFVLAMAQWRMGHKQGARKCYDEAAQWMDKEKPLDEDLRRYRAEAAELLGIKDSPQLPGGRDKNGR